MCACVRACVRACACVRANVTYPFIIYANVRACYCDTPVYNLCDFIFVLQILCSITCICCCKHKCFGVPLHVLKLMSLILRKLNCPVRDD